MATVIMLPITITRAALAEPSNLFEWPLPFAAPSMDLFEDPWTLPLAASAGRFVDVAAILGSRIERADRARKQNSRIRFALHRPTAPHLFSVVRQNDVASVQRSVRIYCQGGCFDRRGRLCRFHQFIYRCCAVLCSFPWILLRSCVGECCFCFISLIA